MVKDMTAPLEAIKEKGAVDRKAAEQKAALEKDKEEKKESEKKWDIYVVMYFLIKFITKSFHTFISRFNLNQSLL